MIKNVLKDKKKLALYAAITTGLIVVVYLFTLGIGRLNTAEANYNNIKAQVQAETVKASALLSLKQELSNVKIQWDSVKQPYVMNAQSGDFYNELGSLAKKYGIKDILITPQPVREDLYMGHLRAVPYDLQVKGSFPNVFNLLAGLEKLEIPAEIKPISIQQEGSNTVLAKATVFLYSLNPPEVKEYVNGTSGRYNPFFNPDIQSALRKQAGTSQQTDNIRKNNSASTQANTAQPNNAPLQQGNTQTSNTQTSTIRSDNAQTSATRQNNAQTNSVQQNNLQTGTIQTVPPYKKPATAN